jgi:uncharacterized protein with GYD domain
MALNGRGDTHQICPLLKVNRPRHLAAATPQFDPKGHRASQKFLSTEPLRRAKMYLLTSSGRGELAMHFCLTGQYTPQALSNILDNPTTNRQEAAKKSIETAGGKLISFYGTAVEGPGVLVIFDVPDPGAAAAISGVVVATEVLQNVKLTRLLTQDEILQVRKHAVQVRSAYKPPGK